MPSVMNESSFIGIAYIAWIMVQKRVIGVFPYPFLDQFSAMDHVIFYAVSFMCLWIVTLLFHKLIVFRWGNGTSLLIKQHSS